MNRIQLPCRIITNCQNYFETVDCGCRDDNDCSGDAIIHATETTSLTIKRKTCDAATISCPTGDDASCENDCFNYPGKASSKGVTILTGTANNLDSFSLHFSGAENGNCQKMTVELTDVV